RYAGLVACGFVRCAIGKGSCATPGITAAIITIPDDSVGLASGIYKLSATRGGALGITMNTTIAAAVQVKHSAIVASTTSSLPGLLIIIIGLSLTQIIIPKNIKA